ncbi:MAG: tetratricopeptide repeat protein [Gemmatimonadetes bacterium]|nr:tetratricopeptide repeat protein [Gemmatimonadota bacterium]
MPAAGVPKTLIVATFVALSVGFGAGYWMATQSEVVPGEGTRDEAAPHPVGTEEYVQLGMTALGRGEFQEAERRFRQALDLAPESPDARTNLAVALMYQERWDEAWEQIQRAEAAAPDMPGPHFLEGIVLRDARGDTAGAREAWNRFLELVPEDSPQAATVREWIGQLDGEVPAESGGETEAGSPTEPPAGG